MNTSTALVILPPARVAPSKLFKNVENSSRRHNDLLAKMQRFRGLVYSRDQAVPESELTSDGRHKLDIDDQSWHVLALNQQGEVCGCVRYLEENTATPFDDLWIRNSALACCPVWGDQFRRAVEQERALARQKRFAFAEVGGWAVSEDRRWTIEPLRMILAVWGLSQLLGGCNGVATATVRHGSAVILRRIGLGSMVASGTELPSYYDPHYDCQMEALRFDSDFPNPKYRKWIQDLRCYLQMAPVVCGEGKAAERPGLVRDLPRRQQPVVSALVPAIG